MVVILDAKCLYLGCKTRYFIFERREEWGQIFDVWSIHPILRAQLWINENYDIGTLEREIKADLITTSIEIFTSSSLSIIISLSLLLYVIIIIIIIYYHSSTTNKTIIMLRYNNIRPTQCDLSVPPIQCALIMWKYNAGLARLISLFLPLVVVVVEECYIIIIIILLLPQPKEGLMLIMLRVGSTATNEAEPNE